MQDFLGTKLEVGDRVLAIFPNCTYLAEAEVVAVTEQTAVIVSSNYIGTPYEHYTSRVHSNKLVKLP